MTDSIDSPQPPLEELRRGVYSVQSAEWSVPAPREAWQIDGRPLSDAEWAQLQAMMGVQP